MATAKRWWNGSSWSTTEATWVYINTWTSSSYCCVVANFYIIAYDDGTLGFSGTIEGSGSGTAVCSGSRNITENENTITTFSMSNTRSQSRTASISSPTATIGWNGSSSISVWKNDGQGVQYGAAWGSGSGSTTLTTPFAYIITYNDNGGTSGPGVQAVFNGESPTISLVEPTRTNRTFLGWTTSSTSRIVEYSPGDPITASSNVTLYAIWDPADDGAAQTISATYNNSTILTIPNMITVCPVIYNNSEITTLSGAMTRTLICQGKIMNSDVNIGSKILTCKNKYMNSNIIVTSVETIYASIDVILSHFPDGTTVSVSPDYAYSIESITGGKRVNVTRAGTYTVTATYGSTSKTGSVIISSYGEIQSITLEYYLYLMTGNPLDLHTDITRQWAASGIRYSSSSGATKYAPTIGTSSDGYRTITNGATWTSGTSIRMGAYVSGTSNAGMINSLTGYSRLILEYDITLSGSPGQYRKYQAALFATKKWIWDSEYQSWASNSEHQGAITQAIYQTAGTTSNQTLSINLSGGGYVQIGIGSSQNYNPGVQGTIKVKALYATP